MRKRFVVVGGGLAAAKAVQTLREEGFDGDLVLFSEESEPPYERPPLSKGLLLGQAEPQSVYVHPAGWYAEHDVSLRTDCPIVGLDPVAHELRTSSGESVGYHKLLIATGAAARRLELPGADAPGVYYLRTLQDSLALRAAIVASHRVVIVGAGWIGLEAAAAARSTGAEVVVVDPAAAPLLGALGRELGGFFGALHRKHGVALHLGVTPREVLLRNGRAAGVALDNGTRISADLVIVGIGATPRVELARQGGLAVSDGIECDTALRTSNPDIYAAGDVAGFVSGLAGRRMRIEHWSNALIGGPAAARGMLGQQSTYDPVPFFYSDQYEIGMEFAGWAAPDASLVYRGEVAAGEFIVFWCRDGRVLAGMNVNVWDVSDTIQQLIRSGQVVRAEALADPTCELADLVG